MRIVSLLLALCLGFSAQAKQVKIAIIDSGYTRDNVKNLKVCENGLVDLTGTDIKDRMGHGSNVLALIADRLEDVDYCAYVIKIYDKNSLVPFVRHLIAYTLLYVIKDLAVVNYSSSGTIYDEPEDVLITGLVHKGIVFDVAAGNGHKNLDKECSSWPACVKGVTSVGNLNRNGTVNSSSNYGDVIKAWEIGTDMCAGGYCLTGTSMATAVHTAKVTRQLYKQSLKEK